MAPEETLAVEDNINDLEMLKQVKYSFTVVNVQKAVKNICRYVTNSRMDDGEIKVIKTCLRILTIRIGLLRLIKGSNKHKNAFRNKNSL
ncbi:HAD hydrolase family protein [Pseudoramibacter faecis]|uniref:HAD hydrolase family protein n=1 Tax=Pseudoramibacter faecis TaxID=3108534 RepID=UPI003CC9DD60